MAGVLEGSVVEASKVMLQYEALTFECPRIAIEFHR